jgi:hypothetical protein
VELATSPIYELSPLMQHGSIARSENAAPADAVIASEKTNPLSIAAAPPQITAEIQSGMERFVLLSQFC